MMTNCFCEIWPQGDGCPVAKINMPAGTKTWKNCSPVNVTSAALLASVLGLNRKITNHPFQRNVQYKHTSTSSNAKNIPHKKNETFSCPGKFVAGWSTPKLLSTITQYVRIRWNIPRRKVNLITQPLLSVLTVYGMYFLLNKTGIL